MTASSQQCSFSCHQPVWHCSNLHTDHAVFLFSQDVDPDEASLKEMLESAVKMVWDNALNYKIAPWSVKSKWFDGEAWLCLGAATGVDFFQPFCIYIFGSWYVMVGPDQCTGIGWLTLLVSCNFRPLFKLGPPYATCRCRSCKIQGLAKMRQEKQ